MEQPEFEKPDLKKDFVKYALNQESMLARAVAEVAVQLLRRGMITHVTYPDGTETMKCTLPDGEEFEVPLRRDVP